MFLPTIIFRGSVAVSERAQQLADRFRKANEELISFSTGLSRAQWRMLCPREGRTVGVVLYHIAEGHALTTEVARTVALGLPLPQGLVQNKEDVDRKNALQALQHAECTAAETVELLRRNGSAAARFVRGLTDEQLENTGSVWGGEGSVAQLIEYVLIRHLEGHFATLRACID